MKMKNLTNKFATVAATGALLFNAVVPAFAGSYTFEISGNGSNSDSQVEVERENNTGVFQTNTSSIVNNINVKSNTGDNSADDNTGGDVLVKTGDVEMAASLVNKTGTNMAQVQACDCDSDTDVKISGNGTGSDNKVELENETKQNVVQTNATTIANNVELKGNTGDNYADDNTGGEVKIDTGSVKILPVFIHNLAGVNSAVIGGGSNAGSSDVMLKIAGNGSNSDNEIEVENENETGIFQTNVSSIMNVLSLEGFTGDNSASDNTGDGYTDPAIYTGDVTIAALIENGAGFNFAEADCGCVLDVHGSIMGNGENSDNEIELELEDELEVAQTNADLLVNAGEVESETGDNDADDNTGGQVKVDTGETTTFLSAFNLGGVNMFGAVEFELPNGWSFVVGE